MMSFRLALAQNQSRGHFPDQNNGGEEGTAGRSDAVEAVKAPHFSQNTSKRLTRRRMSLVGLVNNTSPFISKQMLLK